MLSLWRYFEFDPQERTDVSRKRYCGVHEYLTCIRTQLVVSPERNKSQSNHDTKRDPLESRQQRVVTTVASAPAWSCEEMKEAQRHVAWNRIEFREGTLFRRWESDDGSISRWQLIVPNQEVPV